MIEMIIRWRRVGLIVGAALVVALVAGGILALAGKAGGTSAAHTITVHGSVKVNGNCQSPGYADIKEGTQVVLTDEHQTVLGTVTLDIQHGTYAAPCSWVFTIANVPTGKSFYGVTISHRGTVQYTEAQLREGVNLSIG